jgi:BirA family biotin operon repressor/biotin-[acetyl-CoA-carboxylase] ligase
LKWPNDVRVNDKKVCGILTELSAEQNDVNYILLGLGINVNIVLSEFSKDLQNTVTSLLEQLNRDVDRIRLTQQLLQEFENEYLPFSMLPKAQTPEILKTWRQYSDTLGRNVRIETVSGEITGLAKDIANDGSLIVQKEDGEEQKIIAGDCIYLEQ